MLNIQIESEGKNYRIGLNPTDQSSKDQEFYSIRMDVSFQVEQDFKSLYDPEKFDYVMNNICKDFKFIDGVDTISCINNFTTFNGGQKSISLICLFPKTIENADRIFIRKNYFSTTSLIQKL